MGRWMSSGRHPLSQRVPSRLFLTICLSENRHFLSDVVFGTTIGILVGRTVTVDLGHARFAVVSPMIPRGGGAGAQLTWLGSADGVPRTRR